jgi:cell division protein ZapA
VWPVGWTWPLAASQRLSRARKDSRLGQVAITIRGRQYSIACHDGQEAHLARLGRYLDQRAEQLADSSAGYVGDVVLVVMVALVVADELTDTVAELESLNAAGAKDAKAKADAETASALKTLTERIERIAVRLEGT